MKERIESRWVGPVVERPLYFGCIDLPGHHLWASDRHWATDQEARFLYRLDTPAAQARLLPDNVTQPEGFAQVTYVPNWDVTILAFWDRSVDTRRGAWSGFILPGRVEGLDALEQARAHFPTIWARYTFPITLAPPLAINP